ncbi:magnesium transporter CorA family protein [uncultured Bacteroides sp.]|uniref:magnesium transporter CorA family protein n=1 Tax=uncultured Bacteroides sp. TaxID=162156 RepID=UPI002610EB4E|nr:magnesium transporter CorA family protein [uncultured Bacteroides sp.]
MRKYLYCEAGFVEKANWLPNCWVDVECPTQDDFDFLRNDLKVPDSFLQDIADTDERPRTDTEGNWLLTILRIPMKIHGSKVPYTTVPIGVITNNEIIVSVCYHSTEMLPDLIEHTRKKEINVPNKFELILRLIYSSAAWFLKYLKQINNEVTQAEKELERSIRNEDLLRLMNLQKSLVFFNTSIRGNEVMIGKLQNIFREKDYQNTDLTDDVIIELKQAHNQVNIYSDILTGTMDAFASIISNNVNTIMKRMTSISIILMVPTLIASFYGMNVDVHIESMPHAFSIIVICSVLLSALAFVIFRKIKWF